ncbi:MAG: helix-turn-helix domain-containing protein [Patescibacteria group bacterium]|nr:helix-turn-helix domain-containing protein [Patescibacteria group bacterium]
MNQILANKILKEINKLSSYKVAIIDSYGKVISSTDNFNIKHDLLPTKSPKAIELRVKKRLYGYLFFDEKIDSLGENKKIIKSIAELIIEQNKNTKILTSDERRIDQISYDFFNTGSIKESDLIKVLKSFNINIKKNRVAILLEIHDGNYLKLYDFESIEGEREEIIARTKRSIETVLSTFYTQHAENQVFYMGSNNFLILKDMGESPKEYQVEFKKTASTLHYDLKTELGTDLTIGIGNYWPGVKGLKESFQESKTALKFGEHIWGENKVYHYDSFGVIAPLFSGANKENINFSREVISKIISKKILIKTLKKYFENDMSLTVTAKDSKIHRNTLIYRLERIESLTGLNPRIFDDAFRLYMALILNGYYG